MDYQSARQLILLHAGFAINENKVGFVGSLRPYQGLVESDFVEIMESLIRVHPTIRESSDVDRDLIGALWEMCYRARILVLDPDSGVQHNRLMSGNDLVRCRMWIEAIESFSLRSLQGLDLPMCMYRTLEYVPSCEARNLHLYRVILPEIERCQGYDDPDVVEAANRAVSMLKDQQPH